MRVALIHSYYSSRQPSGENIAVDLQADALRQAGHDVIIVARRTDELSSPFNTMLSGLTVATGIGASPKSQLDKFNPDIIHCHNLFPNWGSRFIHLNRRPLVTTLHNFRPICSSGTLFRDGEDCTLCPSESAINAVKYSCYKGSRVMTIPLAIASRNAGAHNATLMLSDALIVLSERAKETYREQGMQTKRMHVIPNFAYPSFEREERGTYWIYIGRMTEEKGVLDLVQHWPKRYRLKMFGSGPLLETVRKLAPAEVEVHDGVSSDQARDHLRKSRGLVFPSRWQEGSPMVYTEALACGRPVVARRKNSVADDVLAGRTGEVYDQPKDLELALERAERRIQWLSTRAANRFQAEYSPEVWVIKITKLYEATLAARA